MFKSVQPSLGKRCEFDGSRPKNHISGYISGTGSLRHDPFPLDLWSQFSFQTSLRLFKSVEPFRRNRCEFMKGWSESHIYLLLLLLLSTGCQPRMVKIGQIMKGRPENRISGYISGTGSRRHDPFTLYLWPYFSFQTSPSLSDSVQPTLRKRCEFDGSRPKNHISGYIYGTGSRRHNPFTLVQCLYSTLRMSLRLSKSV